MVSLTKYDTPQAFGQQLQARRDSELYAYDRNLTRAKDLDARIKNGRFHRFIPLDYLLVEDEASIKAAKPRWADDQVKAMQRVGLLHHLDPTAQINGRSFVDVRKDADVAIKKHVQDSCAAFNEAARQLFNALRTAAPRNANIDVLDLQEEFFRYPRVRPATGRGQLPVTNPLWKVLQVMADPTALNTGAVRVVEWGNRTLATTPFHAAPTLPGGGIYRELNIVADHGQPGFGPDPKIPSGFASAPDLYRKRLLLAFFRNTTTGAIDDVILMERLFLQGVFKGGQRKTPDNSEYAKCRPFREGYEGLAGVVTYLRFYWDDQKSSFASRKK